MGFNMRIILLAVTVVCLFLKSATTVANPSKFWELVFIGRANIATGYSYKGTAVGGLSGIDYNEKENSFLVISDDRGRYNKPRFYKVRLDLKDGRLTSNDVTFLDVVTMQDKSGKPFNEGSIDPESIRISTDNHKIYWTSEGGLSFKYPPHIRVMDQRGHYLHEILLPDYYFHRPSNRSVGIRQNLSLESLSLFENKFLYTATEASLLQDGSVSTLERGSLIRILKYDLLTSKFLGYYLYLTESISEEANPSSGFKTNGLVEFLFIDSHDFITVERSYSEGKGNHIRVFHTSISEANLMMNHKEIMPKFNLLKKRLILDSNTLDFQIDNIEGVSLGPKLLTGENTLIFVSDNNFNKKQPFTQFLAFKIQ